MTRVKVCGITNPFDARLAVHAGADALGLLFAESPRRVTVAAAREILEVVAPFITPGGVFMDAPLEMVRDICRELRLHTVQLHGMESPDEIRELRREFRVIKTLELTREDEVQNLTRIAADAYLLDARGPAGAGGTGRTCDWTLAAQAAAQHLVVLAGGLSPDNVREAVRTVRPFGVDASSRLEESPGKKDPALLRRFVEEVRKADLENLQPPDLPADASKEPR
ncbi:MAG: phosphoribosylanthranilate isomerase [Planctomycetota bacterium]